MANSFLLERYRKSLADAGINDPRDDELIVRDFLGPLAEQNKELFTLDPELAKQWGQIRESDAPSLPEEAGRALKSGTRGLASTALGGLGLVTGSDYLKEKARGFDEDAAANAPTISTLEDIAPGEDSTAKKIFSRDALRYGIAKVGGVAPSIAESLGTAAIGAALGTAAAPVAGTLVGAAEGVLNKSLVKAAIKRLLAKGVAEEMAAKGIIEEASATGIEQALKAGSKAAAEQVAAEAAAIGGVRGGVAANVGSSFLLNSGDVASEGADTATTLALGVVSALPDTILPAYVLKKLFPGAAKKAAVDAGKSWLARNGVKIAELAGVPAEEFGQEYFQEAINVVARNIKEGKDPLTFEDADFKRLREAGIGGAAGGLLAAPGVMMSGGREAQVAPATTPTPTDGQQIIPTSPNIPTTQPGVPSVSIPGAPAPVIRTNADIVTSVEAMTPEQKVGRATELAAIPTRTPEQQTEFDLLRAEIPRTTELVSNTVVTPTVESEVVAGEATGPRSNFTTTGMVFPTEKAAIENAEPNQSVRRTAGGSYEVVDNTAPDVPPSSEVIDLSPAQLALPAAPTAPTRVINEEMPASATQAGTVELVQGVSQFPDYYKAPRPLTESLGSISDALAYREERISAYKTALQREIGISPEQAQRLSDLLANERETGRFEKTLTAEQQAKFDAFFEGPLNQRGGPLESWSHAGDEGNLPQLAESADKDYLADQIVGALGNIGGAPSYDASDRFLYPVVALIRLRETGGSWRDVMASLKRKTDRISAGDDSAELQGGYAKTIKEFSDKYGIVLPIESALPPIEDATPKPLELPPVVPSAAEPITSVAETMVATATPALPVPIEAALTLGRDRRQVEADIGAVGRELSGNITAERKQELRNDSIRLFEELAQIETTTPPNPRDVAYRTAEEEASQMPAQASRTQEFETVVGRLQQQGARVDVFARQFFAQGVRSEIEKQIAGLQQRQAAAQSPSEKIAIGREITRRQTRMGEIAQAQGATFTPWHIAMAVEDVQNASSANLVTLLHEATEALGMRLNPVMKGRILRAIDRSIAAVRQRATEASERTGVPLARETGPMDLLSETLAQELTAEGVPDSPSLARAIWRWIKDIYYRTAMSLQAAFGGEPSDERALDWFNNQLERVVGGDYDYRIAGILDRYAVPPMQELVTQQRQAGGTPHGVTDYFDPYLHRISQPSVLPYTTDGVDWNVQFQQVPAQKTALGEEIPDVEARARIQAAALNRYIEEAEKVRVASGTTLSWADWWSTVGTGDDPRVMVATLDSKLPGSGSAAIGGDRMNQYMNGLAAVDARELIEHWQVAAHAKLAKANDAIESASDDVIAASKLVNRLEEDRRNAELHEATLQDKLKKQIQRFVNDNSQGYKLAEQKGELDAAVRQAEDLLDGEQIPENYQQVFKAILDGEIPVFSYIRAIAELDLPLSDLSQREVVKAIRDNAATNTSLGELVKNRPLLTALAMLARRNAGQMDEIHLGWLKKGEQYRVISEELDGIRKASDVGLREMIAGMRDRIKGATLRDRIVRDYLKRRRALNAARAQVGVAQVRSATIDSALPGLAYAVERAQQQGSEAPSEWTVDNGAVMTEMKLGADGKWTRGQRTIRFNPDGSIADGAEIEKTIVANNLWLKENIAKKGGALWQSIDRQTTQLKMIDARATYAAAQAYKMDTFLGPIASRAKQLGGGGERAAQMLQFFEHIRFINHAQVQTNASVWSKAWRDVQKATGITDNGIFQQQIYDPINYFLNTNPGLDEQAAIRIATRMARARLTTEPSDKFNESFARLLSTTKTGFEYLIGVADKNGAFVKDPTLKSELRRAVAQGWLTSMRSVDGGLVLRVTTDMEKSGWKLAREQKRDSRGINRTTIVGPVTFRDVTAKETSVANSDALSQRLTQLFTPGIIRDWLVPFINKGGVEVFKHGEDAIPQLTLQNAWAQAKGNVLAWIDAVGAEVGLGEPQELANKETTDPVADFRLSMLRQLDALFAMESKIAAESNQTRNMFDPMGPKPHVMMDARMNDTLPAEHMDFALLDRESSQMLLSEIAFHAAFGRNGIRMVQTLDEMNQKAGAAKSDYEGLRGTTKAMREAEAVAMGYKSYKELERTADRAADIKRFQETLEKQMSVGNQSGPFAEARAGMALTAFMAGQIADGPKVAFYNLLSLAQTPFATRSLGPKSLRAVTDGFVATAKTGLGSILEALNLHIMHATQEELDIAQTLGSARNQAWDTTMADIGPGGRQSLSDKVLVRPISLLKYVQQKGIALPIQGQARDFPRLALVPGLGVSNSVAQIAAVGGMTAYTKMLRRMITRGVEYLAGHKDDAQNPSFRFKAADLGMGRWDKGMFDWWSSKSVEYGLGTLEEIVRGAIPAVSKGERVLTKDQVLRVAQMVATEVNGDSSINTMPSMLIDNPKMRAFFPLLRWPFWAMHKTHEGLRTIDGKRDYVSVMKGLGILAMWNLPIGLAFTFLLDKYDEDLMGKKSNLPPTGITAALPFVGPVAEAILADRSIPDTFKGYMVRMARAGNIYGVASDFLAGIASPADAGSGRRIFSLDQRILVMSQLLNVSQAITNAVGQDWTTTWASVWSPMMRGLGGNAALQVLDLTNNVLGLDNAESRLVARQNASNWIRASAAELDLPLRGGGSSTPTPQSVWTREMLMSAMANDRIGFMDAYRKAIEAARKAVATDPTIAREDREHEAEKRVLAGWRGRDPLTVFAHRPTDIQLRQLYSIMDDTGRQEVQDSLRRFQQYTRLIAPSQQDTQARALERRITRPQQMVNPFRREMAGIGY